MEKKDPNENFSDRLFKDLNSKENDFLKREMNDYKEVCTELRNVFNLIKPYCGTDKCSSCCCNSCGENGGYFIQSDNTSRKVALYFKKEIEKVLENPDSKNWNGFHNKNKGCMLPPEIRSVTCLIHLPSHCCDQKYRFVRRQLDKIQEHLRANKIYEAHDATSSLQKDLELLFENKVEVKNGIVG